MANTIKYKDTNISVGDTIGVEYKIKESDDKERIQEFSGIVLKIKGDSDAKRMITVRKISKSGIGVERIFPLASPFIADIKLQKESHYTKSRAYFIRDISGKKVRQKLYSIKK